MNRLWLLRMALLVLLAWLAAGVLAGFLLEPPPALIGGRRAAAPPRLDLRLGVADVGAAAARLEKTPMWGVQRDGKPLPPPKKAEETAKAIEWRLLAAVERNGEYLAVIQVDKDKPQPVKEGESLPDGGKLLKVRRDRVVVSDAEGNQREIRTYVE